MTEQMTFNMNTRKRRPGRPHHRTTTLTTTNQYYQRLLHLTDCEDLEIPYVNDIISSCSGGSDNVHHSIRRTRLLHRQLIGGFRKVKVRCEQGQEIVCYMISSPTGADDDCQGKVWIAKNFCVNLKGE